MERITIGQLERITENINRIAGTPMRPYERVSRSTAT